MKSMIQQYIMQMQSKLSKFNTNPSDKISFIKNNVITPAQLYINRLFSTYNDLQHLSLAFASTPYTRQSAKFNQKSKYIQNQQYKSNQYLMKVNQASAISAGSVQLDQKQRDDYNLKIMEKLVQIKKPSDELAEKNRFHVLDQLKLVTEGGVNVAAPYVKTESKIISDMKDFIKSRVIIDSKEQLEIMKATMQHGFCEVWKKHRKLRITASSFGKVAKHPSYADPTQKVYSIIYPPDLSQIPAIKYGNKHEPYAREVYQKLIHTQIAQTGFIIDMNVPWFGVSPDGIIEQEDGGTMMPIEIKCPMKAYSKTFEEYVDENNNSYSFISKVEHPLSKEISYKFNESHDYYYQIQGSLQITGTQFCDFVVYSNTFIQTWRIRHDKAFCKDMFLKMSEFYFRYYLPEILHPTNPERQKWQDTIKQKPGDDLRSEFYQMPKEDYEKHFQKIAEEAVERAMVSHV